MTTVAERKDKKIAEAKCLPSDSMGKCKIGVSQRERSRGAKP